LSNLGMQGSKPCALPLGDAPFFSADLPTASLWLENGLGRVLQPHADISAIAPAPAAHHLCCQRWQIPPPRYRSVWLLHNSQANQWL